MRTYTDLIVVDGITKIFGNKSTGVLALDNISFSMRPGANSILGPNGAGKSTLIKILLGYLRPDKGSAQVLGYDIEKESKEIKKRIGYMPEHYTLIPGVNAVKMVSLLGRIAGLPTAEAMQRAHETLQYVGLDESRYREVTEFSTGMMQRLKLAQAMVNDPELIILDEPTNGLDPKGRVDMIDLVYEISHEHGINVIVSSHLLPDIEATCDYTTILHRGRMITQGSISELTGQETKTNKTNQLNVKIKGNFNVFLSALKEHGFDFRVVDKVIQIPFSDKNPSQEIIEIAFDTETQIRSMTPRKAILEDVFVHSIESENNLQSLSQSEKIGAKPSNGGK